MKGGKVVISVRPMTNLWAGVLRTLVLVHGRGEKGDDATFGIFPRHGIGRRGDSPAGVHSIGHLPAYAFALEAGIVGEVVWYVSG